MSPASEALYFDNAPVAHIVAHQERARIQRIQHFARASRSWDSMASRLAADHRDYRARLADAAARINGGHNG